MKRTTVSVGTVREFFERGRHFARRARMGERLPESRLITFEEPIGKTRRSSAVKRKFLRPG